AGGKVSRPSVRGFAGSESAAAAGGPRAQRGDAAHGWAAPHPGPPTPRPARCRLRRLHAGRIPLSAIRFPAPKPSTLRYPGANGGWASARLRGRSHGQLLQGATLRRVSVATPRTPSHFLPPAG